MDTSGLANGSFWWIVAGLLFLIALFVLWRTLNDLRRIAVGIEALTKWASVFHDDLKTAAPRPSPAPGQPDQSPAPSGSTESGGTKSMPMSTFGR